MVNLMSLPGTKMKRPVDFYRFQFLLPNRPWVDSDWVSRCFTCVKRALFQFDNRNNIFTPTRGTRVDVSAINHSPSFGGDWTYQKYRAAGLTWFGVHPKVTLGLRLDGSSIYGEPPFYAVPYIDLRGIAALRYQDDVVVVGEVEASWQAYPRWSVQGFLGNGRGADQIENLGSAPNRTTYGTGFRYMIARRLGLHTGIDIARGPEETVVYIQIGHAWSR